MDCPEWSREDGPREAAELGAWRDLQARLSGASGGDAAEPPDCPGHRGLAD